LPNYELHGKGAIWHIRWKNAPKVQRPDDPKKAILSMHRPLREAAAKKLAGGGAFARGQLAKRRPEGNERTPAAILTTLLDADRPTTARDLYKIAITETEMGLREVAVAGMRRQNNPNLRGLITPDNPPRVRALAVRGEDGPGEAMLIKLFDSADPFL